MQCEKIIYPQGMNFPRPRRCSKKAIDGHFCFIHRPEYQKVREVRKQRRFDLKRQAIKREIETEMKRKSLENTRQQDQRPLPNSEVP